MDTNAEFTSLVAAHRRLMNKYGHSGRTNDLPGWREASNAQGNFPVESFRSDGNPWIPPSLAVEHASPYLASDAARSPCCPRCHFCIGSKPLSTNSFADSGVGNKGAHVPALPSRSVPGMNNMISLQLASMEYARVLAALNTHNAIPHYPLDAQQDIHPYAYSSCAESRLPKRKILIPDSMKCQTIPVKRTRLVWTEDLHLKFVDAVERIGIDKAVPKAILEAMGVKGLTRENVASHLQKYRKKIRQGVTTKRRRRHCQTEASSAERSTTTHGSNDIAEIDSSGSATNNTGYSCITAMPEEK